MAKIKASIGLKKYKTLISSDTNQIIADEPLDLGGEDLGFSPTELLAASLGACTCATLRMYADRKQWPLEDVEVKVNFERDATINQSTIHRKIQLFGNLTKEQKQRLLTIANSCYVHRTLSNPIHILSELEE